jgi:hypothetical protein
MWSRIFIIVVLAVCAWKTLRLFPFPTRLALAPDAPIQTLLQPNEVPAWTANGDKITPLARYDIRARILSLEPYWFDSFAKVCPVDFALGWQKMSNPEIYEQCNVAQSGRFYFWHYSGDPPIPFDEIVRESANTHILPATPVVTELISGFRTGDVVHLTGYLVQVDDPDGYHWRSSLVRTDTGPGACEIFWVEKAWNVGR